MRVRQRDLVQLQQIASTYPSRERFLTEMALDPPDATSAEAGAPWLDDDYACFGDEGWQTSRRARGPFVQVADTVRGRI